MWPSLPLYERNTLKRKFSWRMEDGVSAFWVFVSLFLSPTQINMKSKPDLTAELAAT